MSRLIAVLCLMSAASRAEPPVRVTPAAHHDVSPPLWLIPPAAWKARPDHEPRPFRQTSTRPLAPVTDPVLQTYAPVLAATPTLSNNFEAMSEGLTGPQGSFSPNASPPDTDGAVGPNDYVSLVNSGYAVISKTSPFAVTFGPVQTNTLWSGFGSSCGSPNDATPACACQNDDDGDGVVLYDRAAGRWFITQFAVSNFINNGGHDTYQCVAVSKTGDPAGQFYRYVFTYSNLFNDYGKFGAWPDGYYATYNTFDTSQSFLGGLACAFDRTSMLSGAAATQICKSLGTTAGALPSDLDGATPPPSGSPNYIVTDDDTSNSLLLWKFHVDWTTPANSTLTGPTALSVAAFSQPCSGTGGTCIVEPIPAGSASETLDSLGDRMMFRLAYRNFGDHEALVTNRTVSDSVGGGTGIRWYEIRDPNGTPAIFQQGTFAPTGTDANFRWMGSIAMDHAGDIALGYSVSSSTLKPTIRYTGRVPGDAAGTMETEVNLFTGTGSEVSPSGTAKPVTRWGDYSSMTVDPTDDCTFWYVGEYLASNGQYNWHTRVGFFKFPGCSTNDFSLSVTNPASTQIAPGASADWTVSSAAIGTFTTPIALSVSGLPAGVTGSFTPATINPGDSSTLTLTADSGAGTISDTTFTITGDASGTAHSKTSVVSVGTGTVASDFGITVTPNGGTVLAPGGSLDFNVDTTAVGPSEDITLSLTGALPTGVTATFLDNPLASGSSTVLTLSAAANAPNASATTLAVKGTAASGGPHTDSSQTFTVAGPNYFSIDLQPADGAVPSTGTATFTVTTAVVSGNSTESIALDLSSSTLPAGVTASVSPATIHAGGSATITVTASGATVSDSGTLEVDATSASDFESTSSTVTVVAGNFSLSISPSSGTVAPGGTKTYTVSAATVSGAPTGIALTVSGLPTGVTGAFNPASIEPGGTSTLTLTAANTAPTASATQFTVQGLDSDSVAQVAHATIAVSSSGGGGGNDFSLSLTPTSASVQQGHSTTVAISTAVLSGTAESVALSVSGLPTGVTSSFDHASVTAGGSATLTLTAASTATLVSSAPFTVTGTATSHTHGSGGALTVTSGATGAVPTVQVTHPANGDTVSGTVEIDATAAPGAGATLVKIELRVDGQVINSATSSPAQAFWQSVEATNGSHDITARAVDSSGASTTSATVTVTLNNTGSGGGGTGSGGGGCSSAGAGALALVGLLAMKRRRVR